MTSSKIAGNSTQLSLFYSRTVNVSWVAHYLGVSSQTVYLLIQEGKLSGYQLRAPRGWWRIIYDSVVEYEASVRDQFMPAEAKKR